MYMKTKRVCTLAHTITILLALWYCLSSAGVRAQSEAAISTCVCVFVSLCVFMCSCCVCSCVHVFMCWLLILSLRIVSTQNNININIAFEDPYITVCSPPKSFVKSYDKLGDIPIEWISYNLFPPSNVQIDLYGGRIFFFNFYLYTYIGPIVRSTPNTGSYLWQPYANISAASSIYTRWYVRVRSVEEPGTTGSSGFFYY